MKHYKIQVSLCCANKLFSPAIVHVVYEAPDAQTSLLHPFSAMSNRLPF
jgi:hypothetical protein